MVDRPHKWGVLHEGFSAQLQGGTVVSKNKVLELTDAEHEELKDLIENHQRTDISSQVRYLDPKMAEVLARKHIEDRMLLKNAEAHRGAGNTNSPTERKLLENGSPAKPVIVPVPEGVSLSLKERLAARSENVINAAQEQSNLPNIPVEEHGSPDKPDEVAVFTLDDTKNPA
jgi:hypothetical protein